MEQKNELTFNKNFFVVGFIGQTHSVVKQKIFQLMQSENIRTAGFQRIQCEFENGEAFFLQIKLENNPHTLTISNSQPLKNSITMIVVDPCAHDCMKQLESLIKERAQSIDYCCIVCSSAQEKFDNLSKIKRLAKALAIDVILYDELSNFTRFSELCTKYASALSMNQYIPVGFHVSQLNTNYVETCYKLAKEDDAKASIVVGPSTVMPLPTMNEDNCCFHLYQFLKDEATGSPNTNQFKRLFVGRLLKKTTISVSYQSLLLYGFIHMLAQSQEVKQQLSTESLRNKGLIFFLGFMNNQCIPLDITRFTFDLLFTLIKEEDSVKQEVCSEKKESVALL